MNKNLDQRQCPCVRMWQRLSNVIFEVVFPLGCFSIVAILIAATLYGFYQEGFKHAIDSSSRYIEVGKIMDIPPGACYGTEAVPGCYQISKKLIEDDFPISMYVSTSVMNNAVILKTKTK